MSVVVWVGGIIWTNGCSEDGKGVDDDWSAVLPLLFLAACRNKNGEMVDNGKRAWTFYFSTSFCQALLLIYYSLKTQYILIYLLPRRSAIYLLPLSCDLLMCRSRDRIPDMAATLLTQAKMLESRVLRIRCTIKNNGQVVKISGALRYGVSHNHIMVSGR